MNTEEKPGQLLARGVCRHLRGHGFAAITEFVPTSGLRVDVIGIGPKSEIWIIECKSSRIDFMTDSKWEGYLPWCDRYFWAVDGDFDTDLLPQDTGIIIADAWDAEIQRWPEETKLAAARRKALVLGIARTAATRLQTLTDPNPAGAPNFY